MERAETYRHASLVALVGLLTYSAGCSFDSSAGTGMCESGARSGDWVCTDGTWVQPDGSPPTDSTGGDISDTGLDTDDDTAGMDARDTTALDGRDSSAPDATRDAADTIEPPDAVDGGDVRDATDSSDGFDAADSADTRVDTGRDTGTDTGDTLAVDSDSSDTEAEIDTVADTGDGDATDTSDTAGDTADSSTDTDGGLGSPGDSCSSDADCANGPCVSGASGSVCAHTMFLTSNELNGKLGGLGDMDTQCNQIASNAGFSGNWQVVASNSSATAKSRTSVVAPIYNTNSRRVADDKSDLWDGFIQNKLNWDESGGQHPMGPATGVWTGTTNGGTATGIDCSNWNRDATTASGTFGDAQSTTFWSESGTIGCDTTLHLYCIDGQ